MTATKRVFANYKARECDVFSEYLHEKSLQGWHFKEWRFGLVFEKGEPQDIVYDIQISPKASDQDMRPSEDTKDFADYCEVAGWKLLDSHGKICVFQKIREDARPIVSEEEKFENIAKEEKAGWFRTYLVVVALSIVYLFEFIVVYFERWAFNNMILSVVFAMIIMGIIGLIEGVRGTIWKRRQKECLERGEKISYCRRGISVSKGSVLFAVVLVFLVINIIRKSEIRQMIPLILLFSGIGIIIFIVSWWKPLGESKQLFEVGGMLLLGSAIIVMICSGVFFKTEEQTVEFQQSIFGNYVQGEGSYSGDDYRFTNIEYEIYISPYAWVTEKIWKDEMRRMKGNHSFTMKKDESVNQAWGAEEGYAWGFDGDYMYYMKYPNCVVDIYVSGNKREKQDGIEVLKEFLLESHPEIGLEQAFR